MNMEENRSLYWKQFKIWIAGLLVSSPTTVILGYTTRKMNPDMTLPLLVAVLFSPLVVTSIYGLNHGFCAAYRYGFVYRGDKARFWNAILLVCYAGIICLVAVFGRREFN
jgi:hypothetical protein